ncbi:MAG: dihydroxy-acid dehydratase [Acidobacteriia bacterium]|nr:dihydroxy-acid dehydratase [Terriglobia bacterium]MBV9745709.1 dihydroxy-acid dehydratase [Terriglobia bacterium]
MTQQAFENAITVLMALGGLTNAIVRRYRGQAGASCPPWTISTAVLSRGRRSVTRAVASPPDPTAPPGARANRPPPSRPLQTAPPRPRV